MEGANPALSDGDAYMAFVDQSMQRLAASEIQQIGANTATVLALENLINPNDPPVQVIVHRLAPDKLLTINPIPSQIADTPDYRMILSSIVLTPQEPISLPLNPPAATPLIDAFCLH
jgi:hypothetical protein